MNAYKCDRRGKLYERQGKSSIFNVTKRDLCYRRDYQQDLCPECEKSLDEWWKTGKEQNNDTRRSEQ